MVDTLVNRTTESRGMAIAMNVDPKRSAWATSASAITAPDRMARNIVTRLRPSVYVSERVASRLQCSVARIWSLAAVTVSGRAGGRSGDMLSPGCLVDRGPAVALHGRATVLRRELSGPPLVFARRAERVTACSTSRRLAPGAYSQRLTVVRRAASG